MDMFMQHVNGKFERPSRLVPETPVWLDTLICQLLEKQPDKRPLNAEAVGEALARIREKVEAQQSAGVDAAKRRVIDRTEHQERFDETDREAARTLLRKKPKKKKAQPFYTKGWFQGVGILAILLGIGSVLYLAFFAQPSAQSLLDQARPLMESNDPEAQSDARKGPIERFLTLYPDLQGPVAQKMNGWADQVDREQEDRSLVKRVNSGINVNRDADDTVACNALKYENEGKLAEARELWEKLDGFKSEKNREKRALGLLAESKLKTISKVDDREASLIGKLALAEKNKEGPQSEGEAERQALKALKLEQEKEPARARDAWDALRRQTEVDSERIDPDRRVWYLLALKKLRTPS
jgi:hypothetical protein